MDGDKFAFNREFCILQQVAPNVQSAFTGGCYRVWYDDRTWAPIREQLKTNLMVFDELTRAQFISDAYALRERGSVPWSRVLEMVEFLQRETEYAPHFAFQRVRDKLLTAFKGTADMQQIKKFVQKSIDSAYLKHGWSASTDWATASLTTLVTEAACATGDEGCLYNAATLFSKFLTNCQYSVTGTGLCNSDVAADVRRTQYCYGLKRNLQDGVTLVKTMIVWLKENSYYFHRDEDNLLNALACSGDRTLTNSLIADVLTGKYPVTLLEYISQHDDTDSLLWEYFKAHTNEVVYGVPNFSDYAKATAATWNTAQQLNEIDAFLASNEGSSLSNENKQVMADVRATIQHASSSFFKTPSAEGRIKEKQLLVNKAMPEKDKRVPNVLEPKEYYIRIQPYFPYSGVELPPGRNLTFDGVTTFIFTVNRPTSTFTLHALNLEFNEVTLTDANGNRLGTPSVTVNASYEHVIVHPQQTPTVGSTYILQFKYIGLINSYTLGGLFHTYYLDAHGREHWIIATHMQTGVQTRAMFPCLDEPAYKAIFHVTVVYPKGLVALSNMMERQDGWVFIRYPQTPKMSSYLVAFAVGPFVSKSVVNDAGTLIRVWGWEGQEGYLDFALNVSSKCHYSMGEFLDFPYPLSKSDQLGIPEFPAGAMENFGLLIYKYQYIAINPQVHSTDVKQQASAVICHEVAHQWFGDIVTASWWSELVINEGFAHYFQIYIQAKAFRQQSRFLDGKFLIESMQKGLDTDAEVYSSHPIISPERNFDNIVYDKGSSVLRMVKFVLGDDAWQDGLRDFIHTYQYSVADHEMLFAKLTTAAQKHNLIDWCGRPFDASKFLRPWFLQQCFPLVTITNNQLTADSVITQTAFSDITLLPSSNFTYSWPVPLYVSNYVNNTSTLKWIKPSYDNCEIGTVRTKPLRNNELSSPQQSTLSNERAVHWELGNSKMGAFVRVAYDDIGYARLLEDLKTHRSKHFSMADKIAILGDEIDFVRQKEFAGVPFSFRRLIELMTIILPNYPYFGAFKLCQPIIDQLELLFVDGLDYGLFQRFVSALLLDNYQKLGWTPTGDWDNDMARFTMLPYVARYGVGDSASEALKLFDTFVNDCKSTTTGVNNCSRLVHVIPLPDDVAVLPSTSSAVAIISTSDIVADSATVAAATVTTTTTACCCESPGPNPDSCLAHAVTRLLTIHFRLLASAN
ncbi:unnamed protein product [Toxocara canis]|uniref:A2M domain-containing protein n=1 Tax=Toxocara canis TaxID=6265 RepID=A0A183V1W2_TOXCA|nr:unnamed protein product [Toxocara canis]